MTNAEKQLQLAMAEALMVVLTSKYNESCTTERLRRAIQTARVA